MIMEKINGMDEKTIMAMYERLHHFENVIKLSPDNYHIGENKLKKFMAKHNITRDTPKTVVKHETINHIKFRQKKGSQVVSILEHIRNSFAHSNLKLSKDKHWIIEDYTNEKRNELTAYSIIEKELLFDFMLLLEQSKENWIKQTAESKEKKSKKKKKEDSRESTTVIDAQ